VVVVVLELSLGWSWESQAQAWKNGRLGGLHACCLKSVTPGASSGNLFKRAKVFFSELFLRLSGVEELHFDKCLRTNTELRSWITFGISQDLVA